MLITSIEAIPVKLPFHHLVSDALGTYQASNTGIVVVKTEGGIIGLGEISLAWFGGAHGLCSDVNEYWAPLIVGENVMDINKIINKLSFQTEFSKRHLLALAGVEMALFDAKAKYLKIPVFTLLGGKLRNKIPLTGGVNLDSKEKMVESAVQKVKEGYKELKVKVDGEFNKNTEILVSIRKAIPDNIKIRVDVNMAWKNVKTAKEVLEEWYNVGVHMAEQPLGIEQLDDLRWLKENTRVLILLDESVWNIEDAKKVLDANAADLLHVYISEAGGLNGAKRIFELASVYQRDCTIGSMPEGRIGASAALHLAASMPNLSEHPSDIRGFTIYSNDVVNEDLEIINGELIIPDRQGLGITLDGERLDWLRKGR